MNSQKRTFRAPGEPCETEKELSGCMKSLILGFQTRNHRHSTKDESAGCTKNLKRHRVQRRRVSSRCTRSLTPRGQTRQRRPIYDPTEKVSQLRVWRNDATMIPKPTSAPAHIVRTPKLLSPPSDRVLLWRRASCSNSNPTSGHLQAKCPCARARRRARAQRAAQTSQATNTHVRPIRARMPLRQRVHKQSTQSRQQPNLKSEFTGRRKQAAPETETATSESFQKGTHEQNRSSDHLHGNIP